MSYDLTAEVNYKLKQLDESCKMMIKAGNDKANAEYQYRTALAQGILHHRAENMPVTIINDVVRGNKSVAKLKLERDITETTYDAIRESINAQKLTIRVLENQIAREWTTGENGI